MTFISFNSADFKTKFISNFQSNIDFKYYLIKIAIKKFFSQLFFHFILSSGSTSTFFVFSKFLSKRILMSDYLIKLVFDFIFFVPQLHSFAQSLIIPKV